MNFLDTYGIIGTGTSTPPPDTHQEQSLDEEVSQVIGTLGRFWGGFRKQSEAALATARRDFTQVVTQAQREFEKLTTTAEDPVPRNEHDRDDEDHEQEQGGSTTRDAPMDAAPNTDSNVPSSSPSSTPTASSLFARVQSSLPPNILSTVQAQLPESLKNRQNIDFSQLRSTLSSEFQRVQGVTRAQAEEYVHKSEAVLREAVREASEVLRDAVKVIPPEQAATGSNTGMVWDGTDIWMLPGLAASAEGGETSFKGKGKDTNDSNAHRAVSTRAGTLLKELRSNPEIIRVDPSIDSSKESYMAWVDKIEASGTGFGTKAWSERITQVLSDPLDGLALQDTLDVLVPSQMPEEVFWIRYFFRVHQIEQEESKRKALLEATNDKDEDFCWEDDDDESSSPAAPGPSRSSIKSLASSQRTLGPQRAISGADESSVSPAMSPRLSSEDSYDVVSGSVSNAGDVHETEDKEGEHDSDSDWE